MLELFAEQEKLFMQMNSSLLNKNSDNSIKDKLRKIDEELENIGVKKLTKKQVATIFSGYIVNSKISDPIDPPDSDDVTFYCMSGTIPKNWKNYPLFDVLARPTGTNGRLYNAIVNQNIYTSGNFIDQTCSLYASKIAGDIIGKVPFLKWFPYETVFPNGTSYNYTANTHVSTLRSNATMEYFFIYESNYAQWDFILSSNFANVDVSNVVYLTDSNGKLSTKFYTKNTTVYPDKSMTTYAIDLHIKYRSHTMAATPYTYGIDYITEVISGKKISLFTKFYTFPNELY